MNQRDERIRQIREDAAQTKQDLEAAYSQQQTVLQAEISKERKEKNIVTEEKNKATDYAKALLEEGTALQHQFDQQTFELNELRRSNENLTASNQALSNDLRQARAYCESVLARHEAEDDSMVQEQIAITFLYDEACQNQDMQLDASMTGVKTAEPIAVKCGRITEVLRDLRSSNVRLQQEKAAVEQEKADIEQLKANIQRERDEELKTYDETYVLVDQLMKSSKEADGVIEQLKAELKAWKNQAARQKPGSGSESHTMDKSMSGGWKEHGTAPVSVAPMTPAGLKSVETPCDEPASATGEDSFEQAGYRGAGGLLTPESMTTDAGEQPSAYVGTPAAKATKPQAQKGRNLMRDIGKPQHRSSKTTNGLSVVKTSGVTKSTNRVRPSILASKVSSDERDAFAAKLEREAKEKASTKDELDQRQQWLADHGRVFLKKQQDHAIRQRILNDEQHGLAEMQSEYNGHFNRAQDLGRLHHPEKEMMEIFGSTFRGGSEDLGAAKKLKD